MSCLAFASTHAHTHTHVFAARSSPAKRPSLPKIRRAGGLAGTCVSNSLSDTCSRRVSKHWRSCLFSRTYDRAGSVKDTSTRKQCVNKERLCQAPETSAAYESLHCCGRCCYCSGFSCHTHAAERSVSRHIERPGPLSALLKELHISLAKRRKTTASRHLIHGPLYGQ